MFINHLRRCAPEVVTVWGDSEKEKTLLALLDSAYLKGRYSDHFTADREDILLLMQKVYDLQEAADNTYTAIADSLTRNLEKQE